MKKLFAIITIAACFSACKGKTSTDTTNKDVMLLPDSSKMTNSSYLSDTGNVATPAPVQPVVTAPVTAPTRTHTKPVAGGTVHNTTTTTTTAPVATAPATTTTGSTTTAGTGTTSTTTTTTTPAAPAKTGWSKAAKGATIGGVGGAVAGAVIGKGVKGAAIGGVIGAAGGYIIGRKKDKNDGRVQ